ncbi:unnamed protein product [Enterobius vermicularis]|uniref:SMN domain-containing protein n=1 Tax=Enterobius vermicularis TaxID=51028 RepID=A0A0N4VKZ4_ENTVE|nr:unnamed protein product [Enterobius vermicularis]
MMNASSLSSMGFEFPASGSRTFQDSLAAVPDDHLQRLAQMTQHVGNIKTDPAEPETTATMQPDPTLYQSAAAAAYVQQYGNWPNYYQQFGQPMNPAAFTAAAAWPAQCYAAPPHWPTYG